MLEAVTLNPSRDGEMSTEPDRNGIPESICPVHGHIKHISSIQSTGCFKITLICAQHNIHRNSNKV
jgi:hypothetical protein